MHPLVEMVGGRVVNAILNNMLNKEGDDHKRREARVEETLRALNELERDLPAEQPPRVSQETPLEMPKVSAVTTEQTLAYQNREIVKTLLVLETHLGQGCRIMGEVCDCCVKHPLELEKLAEEGMTMSNVPVYEELYQFARKLDPMVQVDVLESGQVTEEDLLPLVLEARGYRKRVMELRGEGKAPDPVPKEQESENGSD